MEVSDVIDEYLDANYDNQPTTLRWYRQKLGIFAAMSGVVQALGLLYDEHALQRWIERFRERFSLLTYSLPPGVSAEMHKSSDELAEVLVVEDDAGIRSLVQQVLEGGRVSCHASEWAANSAGAAQRAAFCAGAHRLVPRAGVP